MQQQYKGKNAIQALAHLLEEMAEASQAGLKTIRFGPDSTNPELPEEEREANIDWFLREMDDVIHAYNHFITFLVFDEPEGSGLDADLIDAAQS